VQWGAFCPDAALKAHRNPANMCMNKIKDGK
jgi:hypothetical protein